MMSRRCFGRGSEDAGGFAFDGCAPVSARADVEPDSLAPLRGVRAGRRRVDGAAFGVAAAVDPVEFVALFAEVEGLSDELVPALLESPVAFEFFASSVSDFVAPGDGVEAGARVRRGAVLAPVLFLAAEEVVRLAGVAGDAGVGAGVASPFAVSFGAGVTGSSIRAPVEVARRTFLSRESVSLTVGA